MEKRLLCFLWGICFLLLHVQAFAQSKPVSGTVTSASEKIPLPGVSVSVKGTSRGTATDANGNFTIEAQPSDVLVFSFIGMKTLQYPVGNATTMKIALEDDTKALEEVVVVGYGTQKKGNLTGAVSTVDVAKTFDSKPVTDPSKLLQGTVPGLTITYGNGGLTAAPSFTIRGKGSINGTGTPLILVDNIETPDLSVINPNDIESISVLKDAASTSIYGARAAFGVVLVKTKSGKRNQKTSVTYSNNFAWSKPTVLPDFSDPVPELQGLIEASQRAGTTTPELFGMQMAKLKEGIANWQKNYAGKNKGREMIQGEDFDFVDNRVYFYRVWDPKKEMLEDYTGEQIHNLSIQGGSENIGYYLSAGYNNQNGILKLNPDQVQKYNISAAINAGVTKWLDVDAKMLYRNYEYETPFAYYQYWYYFWRWGSYFPYGTWNGEYFRHTPAYLAGASTNTTTSNYQRIDLGATVKITDKLNVRAAYTIGRDNLMRREVGGPIMAWDFWTSGTPPKLANLARADQDKVTYGDGRSLVNTMNIYATYEDKFADNHNVKFMAGVNAEDFEDINYTAERRGLLDPDKGELLLATGDQFATGSHKVNAYAGYFGRINYDFKGKYLFEVNGRYDGSSAFSKEDRWAFFPSASVGYRISEESFMEPLKPILSDLKLRASYGSLGNQNVGGQYYIPSMTGSLVDWVSGTGRVQGISAPIAVAQSLTWEKVTTLDIGTDLRLFKDHIGVSFDWYDRTTSGMLANTSVPATFGTGGPRINSGDFRTRGWEVTLNADYVINNDLSLYGIFTVADNKTEFTKWDNPSMLISQHYVGKTFGEVWGFETDRYFTSAEDVKNSPSQTSLQNGNFVYGAGDVKYKDLNGDGVINGGKMTLEDHGDLKVIGNTEPRYQYSARLGGIWKNLDLDIFLQGVGKRDYWGTGNVAIPLYQGADILYAHQLDYWTENNTGAYYPRPYVGNGPGKIAGLAAGSNNFYPQSKYLLDLSYLRLKNITLGYSLPSNFVNKIKLQKLRVYVSGQNLAEFSNVGVPLDPEITDGELGFVGRTFPFQRSYSAGLQVTF